MVKIYMFFFILVLLSSIGGAGYWYYQDTQATIALLRENNTKLKIAAETLQDTVNNMEADAARNEQLNKELTSALQKAEGKLDGLRKRFSQIDIVREAQADPDGLAERINRAVDRLIKEIKDETTPFDPNAVDSSTGAQ